MNDDDDVKLLHECVHNYIFVSLLTNLRRELNSYNYQETYILNKCVAAEYQIKDQRDHILQCMAVRKKGYGGAIIPNWWPHLRKTCPSKSLFPWRRLIASTLADNFRDRWSSCS